jgi:cell division transport system ATP-binding protein
MKFKNKYTTNLLGTKIILPASNNAYLCNVISGKNIPMNERLIELKDANIYQGDSLILSEVNITVQKGEFVYLIGRTGTGKSSLLKTLYGALPLREGEGEVVGFDLKQMTWKRIPYLRRNLGVVFQDFQLLTDRNVHSNLEFVLRATGWKEKSLMEEKINDVLEKVGLKTKGFKMPYELSGGEQQRVDVARALLNSPKLILADEPTGNLDPETSDGIMQLLFQISRDYGTSIIMATHDYLVLQKFPSRLLCTENGKVIDNASLSVIGKT